MTNEAQRPQEKASQSTVPGATGAPKAFTSTACCAAVLSPARGEPWRTNRSAGRATAADDAWHSARHVLFGVKWNYAGDGLWTTRLRAWLCFV